MSRRCLWVLCAALLLVAVSGASAQTCDVPGERYPLWNPRRLNGGALPQVLGVFWRDDNFRMSLEPGEPAGLGPDEMDVILEAESGLGGVDWRKELRAFSCTTGRTLTIATEGSARGPVSMRLNRATEDTFVFAKQFLIEGMRDVHHWDPAYFWPMFGGKVLRIR